MSTSSVNKLKMMAAAEVYLLRDHDCELLGDTGSDIKRSFFKTTMEKPAGRQASVADILLYSKLQETLMEKQSSEITGNICLIFKPCGTELLAMSISGFKWLQDTFKDTKLSWTLDFELTTLTSGNSTPNNTYRYQLTAIGARYGYYDEVSEYPATSSSIPETTLHQRKSARISLKVKVVCREGSENVRPHPHSVTKKILHNSIATDLVIISKGGATHPCHKSFLIAHSPVFEAMFQNEWKEAIEYTVSMDDISQNGVEAVLAYLYYWDLEKAIRDLKMALEVLMFAQKYAISSLEMDMVKTILEQPDAWFKVDACLQFYLTLQQCALPCQKDLERKAIKMLNAKLKDVLALPAYQNLPKSNPDVFLKLTNSLLSLKE